MLTVCLRILPVLLEMSQSKGMGSGSTCAVFVTNVPMVFKMVEEPFAATVPVANVEESLQSAVADLEEPVSAAQEPFVTVGTFAAVGTGSLLGGNGRIS